jgi:oxygen-independent coproporphyrinogen III oxidase
MNVAVNSLPRQQLKPPPEKESLVGNYFVAAYPPFSVWQPAMVPALKTALAQAARPEPLGLYVHVPFCQKKCDYCYYLSYTGPSAETVDRYLDNVVAELSLYAEFPAVRDRRVAFVYFGGGTPSMLSESQVRRFGCGLQNALPWQGVKEVTFECAPRSVRPDFLKVLQELGVTRLSMGVQSFDDSLLKLNGRVHLAADVQRAYACIRQVGFGWVNLDLMAGLIGETWDQWHGSIQRVIQLEPESVTIYQTEIPYNTQLYRDWESGRIAGDIISWKEKRERVEYGFKELARAGYTVVSAYSAVKDPDRHRFLYQDYLWRGADMLGLGVASFGYFGGVHFQNQITLEKYKACVEGGQLPLKRAFSLSRSDRIVREFILQLKWGDVQTELFRTKFGCDVIRVFEKPLTALAAQGFLTVSNDEVRLTADGLLHVDRLLSHFYDPAYREIRYT